MPLQKRGKYYYVEDKKLISVTTILEVIAKPQLITWAARQAAEIALAESGRGSVDRIVSEVFRKKTDAADIGTAVHNVIENITNGKTVIVGDDNRIQAFLDFRSSINPTTLFSEQIVYSLKYGFAGTLDWIVSLPNEKIWLIDFKTGGIYPEAGLQLKAYEVAALEMKLVEKIDGNVVVSLKADGTFEMRFFNEPFDAFLACKALYEWCHKE